MKALLAAALLTLLPLSLRAQTAPLGPGGAPGVVKPVREGGPVSWTLAFRANERWEDNPAFVPDGPSSFVSRGSLDASRIWHSSRGELSLLGNGEVSQYHSLPDLSRFAYGGELTGKYRLSPRFSVSAEQDYSVANALETQDLHQAGLLLPQVKTESLTSRGSFTAQASADTTISGEARYDHFKFDDSGAAVDGQTPLVDGQALVTAATLSQRLGEHSSAGLTYNFVKNESSGSDSLVHALRAVWNGRLGRHWEAGASAGVSRLTPRGGGEAVWNPAGSVDLTGKYPRSEMSVRYSHAISQAFGLGLERVLDFVSANVSRRMSQRVYLRAEGSYGLSRDPEDNQSFRVHTYAATGSLRITLTRELGLMLGGGYNKSSDAVDAVNGASGVPVSSAGALIGLTWERSWQ